MQFEWNEAKAALVLQKHGITFADAIKIFSGDRIEWRSDRGMEERWLTIGAINQRLFAVIYTRRNAAIRLITVRRARPDEERAYHSHDFGRGFGLPQ